MHCFPCQQIFLFFSVKVKFRPKFQASGQRVVSKLEVSAKVSLHTHARLAFLLSQLPPLIPIPGLTHPWAWLRLTLLMCQISKDMLENYQPISGFPLSGLNTPIQHTCIGIFFRPSHRNGWKAKYSICEWDRQNAEIFANSLSRRTAQIKAN